MSLAIQEACKGVYWCSKPIVEKKNKYYLLITWPITLVAIFVVSYPWWCRQSFYSGSRLSCVAPSVLLEDIEAKVMGNTIILHHSGIAEKLSFMLWFKPESLCTPSFWPQCANHLATTSPVMLHKEKKKKKDIMIFWYINFITLSCMFWQWMLCEMLPSRLFILYWRYLVDFLLVNFSHISNFKVIW